MAVQTDYDVIIIGAGIAGLQAARELSQKSPKLKIKVLEAKDRVGGRTYTVTLKTASGTDQWDLGGTWVGETQKELLALMNELNVGKYGQYVDGEKLSQIGGTAIRPYSETLPVKTIRQFGPFEAFDFLKALMGTDAVADKIDVNNPFSHKEARKLDSMSMQSWMDQKLSTRTVKEALDVAAQVVFGTHADRLSMFFVMFYGKAAGKFLNTLEAEGPEAANSFKAKGGMQRLSKMMTDDLNQLEPDTVQLNCPVVKCDNGEQYVTLTILSPNDNQLTKLTAQRVIMAIPPQQAGRIEYSQPLPEHKIQAFQNSTMGNLVKCMITYERPFWRDAGLSGEIVSTGLYDEPGKLRRPLCITFDATTENGNAALVAFLWNEWAEHTKQQRKEAVADDLARFFGEEAYKMIDYEDIIWSEVPYNGGCPVAIAPPGCTHWYMRLREPTGRLHFAGTETATFWPGYITGALQSGLRAAHEILHHMDKPKVDQTKLDGSVYQNGYMKPVEPEFNEPKPNSRLWKSVKWLTLLGFFVGVGYQVAKRRGAKL